MNQRTFRSRMGAKGERGQSIVESMLCLMVVCLILFGVLQLFHLYVARVLFNYAAFTTARSAAVGLQGRNAANGESDGYILRRAMRVAALGASGRYLGGGGEPGGGSFYHTGENAVSSFGWEARMIPHYLSYGHWNGHGVNYEYWPLFADPNINRGMNTVTSRISVDYPLEIPMRRAFFNRDTINIEGEAEVMNYAWHYLQ